MTFRWVSAEVCMHVQKRAFTTLMQAAADKRGIDKHWFVIEVPQNTYKVVANKFGSEFSKHI